MANVNEILKELQTEHESSMAKAGDALDRRDAERAARIALLTGYTEWLSLNRRRIEAGDTRNVAQPIELTDYIFAELEKAGLTIQKKQE